MTSGRVEPGPSGAPDDANNPVEVLLELLERFETDHPDLVKAINDVSHYLSGMGI